jgi:hypothetical protein
MPLNQQSEPPLENYFGLFCPKCGYYLHGVSERRCPECGSEFNPTDLVIEKYRKPFKPVWLIISAFCGSLVLLASCGHAYLYATHTGRCGTPLLNAYMFHILFLPPLLVPPILIMLAAKKGRGQIHLSTTRFLCIVPMTVWATVFILMQFRI